MARATHYSQVILVAGSGEFPLDMLRYDSCVPRTQDDISKLSGRGVDGRGAWPFRIVELHMFSTSKDAQPTRARWLSFGWHVLSPSDRDVFVRNGPEGLREHLFDRRGAKR